MLAATPLFRDSEGCTTPLWETQLS